MIDIRNEELISLCDVPKHIPARKGRRLHIATVYRWAQHGLGGVRLETIRIGGTRFTSLGALQRYFASLSAAPTDLPSPLTQLRPRAAHTDLVLRQAGLKSPSP